MIKKRLNYASYLLRLWQEKHNGQLIWRASLDPPGPGERKAFASLKALVDFLESETGENLLDVEKSCQ